MAHLRKLTAIFLVFGIVSTVASFCYGEAAHAAGEDGRAVSGAKAPGLEQKHERPALEEGRHSCCEHEQAQLHHAGLSPSFKLLAVAALACDLPLSTLQPPLPPPAFCLVLYPSSSPPEGGLLASTFKRE